MAIRVHFDTVPDLMAKLLESLDHEQSPPRAPA